MPFVSCKRITLASQACIKHHAYAPLFNRSDGRDEARFGDQLQIAVGLTVCSCSTFAKSHWISSRALAMNSALLASCGPAVSPEAAGTQAIVGTQSMSSSCI